MTSTVSRWHSTTELYPLFCINYFVGNTKVIYCKNAGKKKITFIKFDKYLLQNKFIYVKYYIQRLKTLFYPEKIKYYLLKNLFFLEFIKYFLLLIFL